MVIYTLVDRIKRCDIKTDAFFILNSVGLNQMKAVVLLLEAVMLRVNSKINILVN